MVRGIHKMDVMLEYNQTNDKFIYP